MKTALIDEIELIDVAEKPLIERDIKVTIRMNMYFKDKIGKIAKRQKVSQATIYNELVQKYVGEYEKRHGFIE